MNKTLVDFLRSINVETDNLELYYEAVTHPSFSNEKRYSKSYQRLEFLGDAILEAVTTEYVYKLYQNMDEGEMTIIRSKAVSGVVIASFAKEMKLDEQIRFGNKSEILRNSEKILADIFEALVAAIYLDQGKDKLNQFLEKNVFEFIRTSKDAELKNPKTILQELLQSYSRENIEYKTVKSEKGFTSIVYHDGHVFGKGEGQTKKEAEVCAAENSLKLLKK